MSKAFSFFHKAKQYIVSSIRDIEPGMQGKIDSCANVFTVVSVDGIKIWMSFDNPFLDGCAVYDDIVELSGFAENQSTSEIKKLDIHCSKFQEAYETFVKNELDSILMKFQTKLEIRLENNDFSAIYIDALDGYSQKIVDILNSQYGWSFEKCNASWRQVEAFVPMTPGQVRMYVCGMTIYDLCHMGPARMLMAFDVVQRWLKASGYQVTYVRNITDIDDKIIRRAVDDGKQDPQGYLQAGSGAGVPEASAIEALIQARADAKKARNFAEADRIRDELAAQGIVLKDGPQGTTWVSA